MSGLNNSGSPSSSGGAVNPKAASGGGGGGGVTSVAGLTGVVTGPALNAALPVATDSLAGTLSANDKTLVDFWAANINTVESQFLFSKNNSLNYFPPPIYAPYYGPGTTLAGMAGNQALIEGGGTGNAATAYATGPNAETWQAIASSLFQTQKSSAWGMTGFLKMPTPITGRNNLFGIRNQAASHTAGFRVEFDINAAAQTKFICFIESTAIDSGIVADGAMHRMTMVVIGANLAFFIDGVSAGTIALSNFTADEPMFPGVAGTLAKSTGIQYVQPGFVRPT